MECRFCAVLSYLMHNFLKNLCLKRELRIAELLKRNALHISVAESCTGGLISSRLTDVSGSSVYINKNFVTYANSAKTEILGVNPETIKKFGVVSEEVASEMAKGLIKTGAGISLSTTGIAGPLGETETKPVGMICIGVSNGVNTQTFTYKANKKLPRRLMKYAFSDKALDILIEFLEENY